MADLSLGASAQIIALPGAAAAPVLNPTRRGRYPANVSPPSQFMQRRRLKGANRRGAGGQEFMALAAMDYVAAGNANVALRGLVEILEAVPGCKRNLLAAAMAALVKAPDSHGAYYDVFFLLCARQIMNARAQGKARHV